MDKLAVQAAVDVINPSELVTLLEGREIDFHFLRLTCTT